MRATLRLSSPAWFAQPRMTSSTLDGSTPDPSTTALMGTAARSSGRTPANDPPCLPTGVLTASTTKASLTVRPTQRSEEHTSELQSPCNLVCRLLLEKKKNEEVLTTAESKGAY